MLRLSRKTTKGPGRELGKDLQCILVTMDAWLAFAPNQRREVLEMAHNLANSERGIEADDRRSVAFCQIEDVEIALQTGSPTSFLDACRLVAGGARGDLGQSIAQLVEPSVTREYPFSHRVGEVAPWLVNPQGLAWRRRLRVLMAALQAPTVAAESFSRLLRLRL